MQQVVEQLREQLRATQEREKTARYLAFHDDLTALPNRRFFRERLERALANGRERSPVLAVMYVDLDGFKALNRAYGHDTGDRLLNLVAERLTHAVRARGFLAGTNMHASLPECPRERLQHIAATLF